MPKTYTIKHTMHIMGKSASGMLGSFTFLSFLVEDQRRFVVVGSGDTLRAMSCSASSTRFAIFSCAMGISFSCTGCTPAIVLPKAPCTSASMLAEVTEVLALDVRTSVSGAPDVSAFFLFRG